MSLQLENLDTTTRQFMLSEVAHDIASNTLYVSNRLNPNGRAAWPELLRESIEHHDIQWLADALRSRGYMASTEQRRKPTGGYTDAAVPVTAPDTLAEGEFNRFYIRGLCQRVLQQGSGSLIVYRAKDVSAPRAESQALIGTPIDAQQTLADLRANPGIDTALGLPPGPNSGLSIRLSA